jgi:DNA polymerase I-like protein with 3'-5' exonuclease and polymerase domains
MYKFTPVLPEVSCDPNDINKFAGAKMLGLDLEWSQSGEPTILGLSDGITTMSIPWEDGRERLRELIQRNPDIFWVMHNGVAADLMVLENLGIKLPLNNIEDTIILMWLVNSHLAKASGKTALEEDEGEKRGRGFFNLGTMLSVYTDIWHYKDCRGNTCVGPCPEHDKYGYNGIDSLGPVLALPALRRQAQLRRVDHLYEMHRELAYVLAQMQEYGVRIDVGYVYPRAKHPLGSTHGESLDEVFLREKDQIERSLPFNPKSPKAVVEFFKEWGLENAQEASVREMVEDLGEKAPAELIALLEYKELGNGANRWFEPQYRDKDGWLQGYLDPNGFVHPRLNFFTSSARLACSSPNFQNVYKRKGEHIRRGVVAPPGWYIVRADYSNAENRYVLHRGGYSIPRDMDLHTWVGEMAGLTVDMELVKRTGGGKIRQAAKSIQHANNILEGLQLKRSEDLRKPKIRAEIAAGARVVYPNWTFKGKVVTFTGVNLARRTYGDATWPHRKDALEISARYFDRFPGVRKFQQEVSKQCEIEGAVRTPLGYCLLSFGDDEDRMKIAQGVQQQLPVAHLTKLALLRLWKRWKDEGLMRPFLQCHDEILTYVKDSVPPEVAMEWLQEAMEIEMPEIPELIIPADTTFGPTWAESDQIGLDSVLTN